MKSKALSLPHAVRWAFLLGAVAASGCQQPNTPPVPNAKSPAPRPEPAEPVASLNAVEEGQLRQRALDFILRAARSDIDVVCCNAIEALVQIDPDAGLKAFRAALNSEIPLVRFAGCIAIGEVADLDSLERIERALSDADPRVQLAAAFAAYRCGDHTLGWKLVETLKNGKDDNLRCDAAFLVGRMGEKPAIKMLRGTADNRATPLKVAVHAVAAMALLGDEHAVDELAQFAQGYPHIRTIALQSILDVASPTSRDALLYRLNRNDEYLENQLIAARALGRLGNRDGFSLAMGALNHVAKNSEDTQENMRVRSLAALALGDIRDARALPALRKMAENEEDPRIQLAAACAICRIIEAPVGSRRPEAKAAKAQPHE